MELITTVGLGKRSYQIITGNNVLSTAGERLYKQFGLSKLMVITDENVAQHHLEPLIAELTPIFSHIYKCVVPAGETTKNFKYLEFCVEEALTAKLERKDVIIALGGGVIGDIAGLTASLIRRGINLVQMPTTLLAQVDSSVGGKTAINSPQGKNLIGSFYQPKLVLADSSTLNTLPKREFAAGYAEIVKYALINQPDFFSWLEHHRQDIVLGGAARIETINRAVAAKAAIIEKDEYEMGDRALLNLGHTFGHALEAFYNYDRTHIIHGEAVAIGMVLAYEFSSFLGLNNGQHTSRLSKHLQEAELPTQIKDIQGPKPSAQELFDYILQDKKIQNGRLRFILTRGWAEAFLAQDIAPDDVLKFLQQKLP